MHFLLTNDDGIHAPGLAALATAISQMPDASYTVVAPHTERSECGHRVTTRTPLTLTQIDAERYAVDGTPADCVRVAVFALGIKPDFVISGINSGGNMGQDLYISGTVAAAREASYHGLPAAAFSHYLVKDRAVNWPRTSRWVQDVLQELIAQPLLGGEFWNVNFPHLMPDKMEIPLRETCHPCRAPLNVSYEILSHEDSTQSLKYSAAYAERPADADSDVAVCFGGKIAVSRLRV